MCSFFFPKCMFILTYCFHIEQVCVMSFRRHTPRLEGTVKYIKAEYERWKSAGCFRFEASAVIVL